MNKIILSGRLARDPDIKRSNNQNGVCVNARFTIACSRGRRNGQDLGTDFVSCIAFGSVAEVLEKYFMKGSRINLCGHIQTGKYQDRNGQTIYTTDVYAENIEFVDTKTERQQLTGDLPPQEVYNQAAAGQDCQKAYYDSRGTSSYNYN